METEILTEHHRYSGSRPEVEDEAVGAAVREAALEVLAEEDSAEVVPEEAGRTVNGYLLTVSVTQTTDNR